MTQFARSRSRKHLLPILGAAAVAAAALPARQESAALKPETARFVREAIGDRFTANDIPDIGLIENRQRVLVLREMRAANMRLTPDALPQVAATEFELISLQEAQAAANRTGRDVVYLTVDDPRIAGADATILLGVDLAMAKAAGMVKLCCCAGRAEFRNTGDRWTFVKWAQMSCS